MALDIHHKFNEAWRVWLSRLAVAFDSRAKARRLKSPGRKLGATSAKRIAPVFALMALDRQTFLSAARERQAIFLGETEPRAARPGSRPGCCISRPSSVVALNRPVRSNPDHPSDGRSGSFTKEKPRGEARRSKRN
jgi:hypothetical protein